MLILAVALIGAGQDLADIPLRIDDTPAIEVPASRTEAIDQVCPVLGRVRITIHSASSRITVLKLRSRTYRMSASDRDRIDAALSRFDDFDSVGIACDKDGSILIPISGSSATTTTRLVTVKIVGRTLFVYHD